jgi:hypothetical protein
MSSYHLKKKLYAKILPLMDHLDPQAKEIVNDLIKRLYPLKNAVPTPSIEKEMPGIYCVIGTGGGIAFTPVDMKDDLFRGDYHTGIANDRFATFTENRQYCEGTEGLLGLLTQYSHVVTEKAEIYAVPDAISRKDGRAVFLPEDLEEYGDKRIVRVTVWCEAGAIMFGFEEKVDKNQKVRPQKVHR